MKGKITTLDELMDAILEPTTILEPTMEIQEEKREEDGENFIVKVIRELSEIKGEKVDIKRPNDVAEFLCPTKDFEKEDKISLYDLLNYLASSERKVFLQSIAYDSPWFLEKVFMNNKYKALARLECQMLGVSEEAILYCLEHDEYEGSGLLPEVLCDKGINDYLVDLEDKEISYMRGLFQDEKINKMAGLVYHSRQEIPKQFNKNPSN